MGNKHESYTFEHTKSKINKLFTKHGLTHNAERDQKYIKQGMEWLAKMDDIGRENTAKQLMGYFDYWENHPNMQQPNTSTYSFFSTICKQHWSNWRERTQRNYPIPTVPEPIVRIHPYAPVTRENEPIIEVSVDNTQPNTATYTLTNHQNTNTRLAIVCSNPQSICDSVYHDLVNTFRLLQCNRSFNDYRYPVKERLHTQHTRAPKYQRYPPGEWYCKHCWHLNDPSKFAKEMYCLHALCRKERNDKELQLTPKVYDLCGIRAYDTMEFRRWKIRIETIIDPLLNSHKWLLPTIFHINDDYQVRIKSGINNLCPLKYSRLYDTIAKVFEAMLGMFEYVLGDICLKDRDLEVIVSAHDYQLLPQQTFYGVLHREGYEEELIEGVGIYYFDKSDAISEDAFTINTNIYGLGREYMPNKVYNQDIAIANKTMLVFNNQNMNHKLKILRNASSNESSTRKLLIFFLPEFKIKHKTQTITHDLAQIGKKYHDVILHWVKLSGIENVEYNLAQLIVLYLDNIIDLVRTRDGLRQNRIIPTKTGKFLPWLPRAN